MATPIGVTDQNDCDLRCLIDRLSGRRPLISPFDDIPPPDPFQQNGRPPPSTTTTTATPPDPGYISILLPVFLVIGVVILVVIIFLLHRFVSILIKKRFRSSRNNDSSNPQSGGNVQSRSNDFDDSPPSYLQMMGSLENSDLPPSYYEIVKGKVNLGFLPEQGSGGEAGDRVEQVSELDGEGVSAATRQDSTHLPNAVAVVATEQSGKDGEKTDDSDSKKKKVTKKDLQQQRTKLDIEEEIDALSVPTVFSSSPVASLSRRGNIKMLKVVPQLAAKRFKSIGVSSENPEEQTTEEGRNDSSDGSVL